jgi:hypothetical protein
MEFNGLLVLAVLWFLLNLITKVGRRAQTPPESEQPQPPTRQPPLSYSGDATQQEGRRLELVLRDFQRALEGAASGPGEVRLPQVEEEEAEERHSLEVEPEVRSLEEDIRREPRRRIDQDDEAEQIELRRIQAAAARDATRTRADRAAFDQPIRQEPAEHTGTRGYTAQQLRDAVIWREILGPPVSLRDGEGER